MSFSKEDFPDPLGPSTARLSPEFKLRLTDCKAFVSPRIRVQFLISIKDVMLKIGSRENVIESMVSQFDSQTQVRDAFFDDNRFLRMVRGDTFTLFPRVSSVQAFK